VRPSTPATLEITAPSPNEVVSSPLAVQLRLEHAQLAPPAQAGGAIRGDQGHIHLLVDGDLVAMPLTLVQRVGTLPRGEHTIQAEFVASDHVAFANRVVAAVTFRVR